MAFRIRGLDPAPFSHLWGMSDDSLRAAGARRYRADRRPGFPDRVELRDANIGESLILVNFEHQPAQTPYRASHAIFVLEGAMRAHDAVDEIPEVLTLRPISLRGFDATGWMIDADLASGHEVRDSIMRLLGDERVAYVHAHYAKPGCYAARIDRA